MSFKLAKINGNQLFTPAILIFSIIVTILLTKQEFKDTYNTYSQVLAVATLGLYLKAFTLAFANLEINLSKKKWLLAGVSLLLGIGQFWTGWLGINYLTLDSYPRDAIGFMLIANLLFSLDMLLNKISGAAKVNLPSLLVYSVLFGLLYLNVFAGGQSRLFLVFLQISAYLSLAIETFLLVQVTKNFVTR